MGMFIRYPCNCRPLWPDSRYTRNAACSICTIRMPLRRRSDTCIRQKKPMFTPCENSGMIEMSDSRIRPTCTRIRQKSRCSHPAKIQKWLKCRIRESDLHRLLGFNVGRILVSDKKTMSTHCENLGMIGMSDSRIRPTCIVRFQRRSDTGIRQKNDVHTLQKFGNDWNVGFENPTYVDCSVST